LGNVSAAPLRSAAEVRADLGAQLTARVRWTETIRAMLALGVNAFIELGSGNVLCGLIRRISPQSPCWALDHPDSFHALGQ
jgi:[acyl-carrier-protein] S-malonyltransferase